MLASTASAWASTTDDQRVLAVGDQPGEHGADGQAHREHAQEQDTARPSLCTYPGRAGPGRFHTCSMVNRPACARPVAPHTSTSRPTTRLVTLARCIAVIWPTSVLPMAGNWLLTAPSTVSLQRRGTGRDLDEHGHQDEQQREHRHERGMGQVRSEHAAVVVPVLLDHAEDERGDPVPLLRGVRPADRPLDRVHAHCAARQSGPQTPCRGGLVDWAQSIATGAWAGRPAGLNLNARKTGRDAAPAPGRTADAVPKGYSDWVRQARVFPGPPGSRPARSLIYTHSGDNLQGHDRSAAQAVRAPTAARLRGREGPPRRGRGERQHGHRDRGHRPAGRDLVPGARARLGQPIARPPRRDHEDPVPPLRIRRASRWPVAADARIRRGSPRRRRGHGEQRPLARGASELVAAPGGETARIPGDAAETRSPGRRRRPRCPRTSRGCRPSSAGSWPGLPRAAAAGMQRRRGRPPSAWPTPRPGWGWTRPPRTVSTWPATTTMSVLNEATSTVTAPAPASAHSRAGGGGPGHQHHLGIRGYDYPLVDDGATDTVIAAARRGRRGGHRRGGPGHPHRLAATQGANAVEVVTAASTRPGTGGAQLRPRRSRPAGEATCAAQGPGNTLQYCLGHPRQSLEPCRQAAGPRHHLLRLIAAHFRHTPATGRRWRCHRSIEGGLAPPGCRASHGTIVIDIRVLAFVPFCCG